MLMTGLVVVLSLSLMNYFGKKTDIRKDRVSVINKYIRNKPMTNRIVQLTQELSDNEVNSLLKSRYPNVLEALDEWHIHKFGSEFEDKNHYELLGEAFISSQLQTTPKCLRIANYPECKQGYIYFNEKGGDSHSYDSFRVIVGSIICEDVLEDRISNIVLKTKDVIESFSADIPVCTLEHLLIDTFMKIHKNKNKLSLGCKILENCNALDFQSVFSQ